MIMVKFRKKPVVIEAFRLNELEIIDRLRSGKKYFGWREIII